MKTRSSAVPTSSLPGAYVLHDLLLPADRDANSPGPLPAADDLVLAFAQDRPGVGQGGQLDEAVREGLAGRAFKEDVDPEGRRGLDPGDEHLRSHVLGARNGLAEVRRDDGDGHLPKGGCRSAKLEGPLR